MDKRKILALCFLAVFLISALMAGPITIVAGLTTAQQDVRIIKGPYLLGTTTDSITIAWETDNPADSVVEYGLTEMRDERVSLMFRESPYLPSPSTYPDGMNLHKITLTGLRSNTVYHYRVISGSDSQDGTFKTLPDEDEPFKFGVIADTHFFETAEELVIRMLEYQPDFIIDCGDIGRTSNQYYEWEEFWFSPLRELIRQVTVFNTLGNHNVGGYWHDYFGHPHSGGNGRWFSVCAGNSIFIILDSNTYCPEITALWEQQDAWLRKVLTSSAFQNATWQFIVQHHPHTDQRVREYLIPIMEEYGIDILLVGHDHSYEVAVSMNPQIGARTMFINTGTAQYPEGEVKLGARQGRPNTIAYGASDYSTIEVNGDTLHVYAHTTLPGVGEGPTGVLQEITLSKGEPRLEFANLEIEPQTQTMRVDVTNRGKGLATVLLPIYDNDRLVPLYFFEVRGRETVLVLDPGETKRVEVVLNLQEPDLHEIRVGNLLPIPVEVQ